jgi:hypothetical protein
VTRGFVIDPQSTATRISGTNLSRLPVPSCNNYAYANKLYFRCITTMANFSEESTPAFIAHPSDDPTYIYLYFAYLLIH